MSRFKIEVYGIDYLVARFCVDADTLPVGEDLLDMVICNLGLLTDAYAHFEDIAGQELDLHNERSDLRNHDDDRVWVIECCSDTDSDTDTDNPAYMIRVEPKT